MNEAIYVSLLTFLLGLFIGNRLSLWRERRKEFNEVAARIRVALKSRTNAPQPYFSTIEKTDMEIFVHLLPIWKRLRFARAWSTYEDECTHTEQDEVGQSFYKSPERVAHALQQAIAFTALR